MSRLEEITERVLYGGYALTGSPDRDADLEYLLAEIARLTGANDESQRWIQSYKHREGYKPFYLDPKRWPQDYPDVYETVATIAREHGYALTAHGSTTRDLDLVAVPWSETVSSPQALVDAICEAVPAWSLMESYHDGVEWRTRDGRDPTEKPHGRLAWSLHLGGGAYIDLSVTPTNAEIARLHGLAKVCEAALEAVNVQVIVAYPKGVLFDHAHEALRMIGLTVDAALAAIRGEAG
jgi:hypothetical protein